MGTLTPHIRRYLAERRSAGTYSRRSIESVEGRLRGLDRSFGQRPLNQLNRRAIERWQATLGHLSRGSQSSYLASVRTFCAWLSLDLGVPNPCAGVPPIRRPRSVPRALSASAVAAVLAVCADDRDRAIVWLEYGCGLRRAEVAAARWEDYEPDRGLLLVHGKGGHEREVPIPAPVAAALAKVRARGATGPIIRSACGHGGVTPGHVGARTTDLCRKAGIKHAPYDGVSGHALRHAAASDTLDACGDLRVVQELLGHQHLTSTAIYLRRAGLSQMREAMEKRRYAA